MSNRKVVFAVLFILGISLLNVAVLIDASNQGSQLTIDAFNQQPIPMYKGNIRDRDCNSDNSRCDIVNHGNICTEVNGKC